MTDENGAKMGQLLNFIAHNVKKKKKNVLFLFWLKIAQAAKTKTAVCNQKSLIKTRTH